MADYFINIKKDDKVPKYLKLNEGHDDDEEAGSEDDKEYDDVEINIEDVRGRQLKMFPLLPYTWPSGEELGLDPSQYQALKAALTRELVVIQGPPGTGKTYMALKIAGILIENKAQMGRKTPILVVCLTNHALDQFLVGMLKFTEKLVRIGGQSKEEKMDQFNLRNQRFRRNKEHYQLSSLINTSYKQLEQVEGTLFGVSNAASKQGFLMDAAVCEINVSPPQFSVWLVGEALSHLVTEYFSAEKETRYISFASMKKTAEKMKRQRIEVIQKQTELSAKTRETQANREEAAHLLLMKSLDDLQINFENLDENDDLLKLKSTEPLLLTSNQRLCLYILSVKGKKEALEQERTSLVHAIANAKDQIEELKNRDQVNFLQHVDVIGMTTNGAARLHKMLSALKCEIGTILFQLAMQYFPN
jgi:energy-coupling factor transporter ATP-binding protein EcfA2